MRSNQKGGGFFSRKNNNKKNNNTVNKSGTVNNSSNLKNSITKIRDQLNKSKEKAEKLLEEIKEHKNKALELSREGKREEAISELKKYKPKEEETVKLTAIIHNLKVVLIHLLKKQKELMRGGNNSFMFNNPVHRKSKKRKTLKRSNGSRNLYSNYNSEYGKLKRQLELPIDASEDELLEALMKPSSNSNLSESNRNLLKELEPDTVEKSYRETERRLSKELEEVERII
jgi:hypothetical protein